MLEAYRRPQWLSITAGRRVWPEFLASRVVSALIRLQDQRHYARRSTTRRSDKTFGQSPQSLGRLPADSGRLDECRGNRPK